MMMDHNIDEDTVTITRAYFDQLVADSKLLANLHAAGVDNWDGYSLSNEDDDI
jgi:hypothetical protein